MKGTENGEREHKFTGGGRESNIELLRIILMLMIVAHHYVVNSGITKLITRENALTIRSLFYFLYGFGGKMAINVFVLITGYFMCQSKISVRKYVKFLAEVLFYNIVLWAIFLLTGYTSFSIKELLKAYIPFYYIGREFLSTYLVFYWFIPFLNKLIGCLTQKQHLVLVGFGVLVGSVVQTFMKMPSAYTYLGWFMILYMTAAYIRLYPNKYTDSMKWSGNFFWSMLMMTWGSVVLSTVLWVKFDIMPPYYFVADSNKFLAYLTAVAMLVYFKNMKIGYHRSINEVAAAVFGVLLIHANSDSMRSWLWGNVCRNTEMFESRWFIAHAIGVTIAVYIVCTLLEWIRLRIIERPFLAWYDKKGMEKKLQCFFTKMLDRIAGQE